MARKLESRLPRAHAIALHSNHFKAYFPFLFFESESCCYYFCSMRLRDEEAGLGFQEMVPMVTIVEMGVMAVAV